jgi:CPA2 family monovalent cation:H+ antiporter-2
MESPLLQDFALILLAAGLFGWVFRKIGLSAVVGYLIAGVIIGPSITPFAFISDIGRINALSELGLVFLMFFVGLDLSLKRIQRMGMPVLFTTIFAALGVFYLCQLFCDFMGWDRTAAIIFAAMFMASSSPIIVKTLGELNLTHERFGRVAQGVTVLDDVVAVVMLTIVGAALQTMPGADSGVDPGNSISASLFLLLGFTVLTVVLGLVLLPRLLKQVGNSPDLASIIVSGLVFCAGLAAIYAGFSVALGAFLFGIVVAETTFRGRVEKQLNGVQDLFSAIFFVSIGMLIEVKAFWEHGELILLVSGFVIVARVFSATLAHVMAGGQVAVAVSSALLLLPVGEFAYVLAQMSVKVGAVPESFYALAVGCSIVTGIVAPLAGRQAERFGLWVDARQPRWLRAALDAYRGFLDAAVAKAAGLHVWQLTQRTVWLTTLEVVLLTGLFGFSAMVRDGIGEFLEKAHYQVPGWEFAYWTVIVILGIVLTVAIWRALHALSMIYAEVLAMGLGRKPAGRLSQTLRTSFRTAATCGLAVLLLFTFPLHDTSLWITVLLLLGPALVILIFRRSLVRLHSRFQVALAEAVEQTASPAARMVRSATARSQVDWGMDVVEILLPDQAACASRTIKELQLRTRFGCSILEIDRQGFIISHPRPDMPLYSGDRLLVFGTESQIQQGRQFLIRERPETPDEGEFDEAVLETVIVPEGSHAHNRSLAQLRVFQDTGVQVVGIERGAKRLLNPSGTEVIRAGDQLLIITTRQEIRGFLDWLEQAPEPRGI